MTTRTSSATTATATITRIVPQISFNFVASELGVSYVWGSRLVWKASALVLRVLLPEIRD